MAEVKQPEVAGHAERRKEIVARAAKSSVIGIAINFVLAIVKGLAGIIGHSYALLADATESLADVFSSIIIFVGVKVSAKPPDEDHPQGHGKFEVLSAMLVSIMLFGAAGLIVFQSTQEIQQPHRVPAAFTLVVLLLVIVIKEGLFRFVIKVGEDVHSAAVKTDAWHHRSDAITSLAAFIGISVALIGGRRFATADNWAALVASLVIAINALILLKGAIEELTDKIPNPEIERLVRETAMTIPGVLGTHRCFVRKAGFDYLVELDIEVDGNLPVREGHALAHKVRQAVSQRSASVLRVFVHVEPMPEHGRTPKTGEEKYT